MIFSSQDTCWLIKEKSFTAARNVASPAQQLVISKITLLPIQEKNRFIVINAQLKHTREKPFSCSQCSFSYSRDGNLKDHIQIHSGEKPFKCNQCNHSSTRASHLKEHKRTHTGEKPYKCDQCNHSCTQAGSLNVHKRQHSREKSFKCGQCNFSCKSFGNLRKHVVKKHAAPSNV